jgi:hypothetical protein
MAMRVSAAVSLLLAAVADAIGAPAAPTVTEAGLIQLIDQTVGKTSRRALRMMIQSELGCLRGVKPMEEAASTSVDRPRFRSEEGEHGHSLVTGLGLVADDDANDARSQC